MPRKQAGGRASEPKLARGARGKPKRPATKSSKRAVAAGFRLPEYVRPRHYRLHIDVDPAASREYRGRVEIELELGRALAQVELHAADLELSDAELGEQSATIEAQPERET